MQDLNPKSIIGNPILIIVENPHLYKVGRGQQGVLICQPYKSELHIHWRFRTPEEATKSAQTIYAMFLAYLKEFDFVGADMAKKYLHMGFTRARRYWNHSSGKKWTRKNGKWEILPKDHNVERFFRSSNIFKSIGNQQERTKIIVK